MHKKYTRYTTLIHFLITGCFITIIAAGLFACKAEAGEADQKEGSRTAQSEVTQSQAGEEVLKLRVAEQYGLAYAPLQIMRRKGFLQEELPSHRIEWSRLGNTAAIREAMLAGQVDVGFMGIPPFLIGFDRGMEWKIFTGLSRAPLGLTTWKDEIRGLADFEAQDRIALPQPGSIQHILLSMACERELGDADALDNLLVTMNHPDGMQALLSRRSISAHFTSPPYLMQELSEEGIRQILSGEEAMGGEFTFIVGVVRDRVIEENREALSAFQRALDRSIAFIENSQPEAIGILAEEYNIDPAVLEGYLEWEGLDYGRDILGLKKFLDFMSRNGYLEAEFSAEQTTVEMQ